VLEYVEKLKTVNVEGVERRAHECRFQRFPKRRIARLVHPKKRSQTRRVCERAFRRHQSSRINMELTALTVTELQAALCAKEASPLDVIDALEARIATVDGSIPWLPLA